MEKKTPDWVLEKMQEEEFLRSQVAVTEADYRDAVEALLRLAQGDTSGSRAAAQVLLSLYNGNAFHMDLTDLCVLDHGYFLHALVAIRGRVVLSKEPHSVVKDGKPRFEALWALWEHLKVDRRYSQHYSNNS